jgi:hypothetical protein
VRIELPNEVRNSKWLVRLLVLVGALLATPGVIIAINGSAPPSTGRAAWVQELLYSTFGVRGPAILWFTISGICLYAARFLWRHTPKRPGDTWL